MLNKVKGSELTIGAGRTVKFEGVDHGSGVSFFLVDNEPGQGPNLHRHRPVTFWSLKPARPISFVPRAKGGCE